MWNFDKRRLLLYAVTDRSWTGEKSLYEQVEDALKGGVTMIQLREKNLEEKEFLKEALTIRELTRRYGVPLIINDNLSVALACDADGIHIGQSDMDAETVRKLIGPNRILGVTAKTAEQADHAGKQGADYLGAGAVFGSNTKTDAKSMDLDTLKSVCEAVNIPVVAIGGISGDNITRLQGTGIAGVAVVSAIFAASDIREAAQDLLKKSKKIVGDVE